MAKFPPRLPEQPIFYPVLTHRYAAEIAERWNVKDHGSGYVTQFRVRDETVAKYRVQTVGEKHHRELWVPADEQDGFNSAIVGKIDVVRHFEDGHDWRASHSFSGDMAKWPDKVFCDRCGARGARFPGEVFRDDDFTVTLFEVVELRDALTSTDREVLAAKVRDVTKKVRRVGRCGDA